MNSPDVPQWLTHALVNLEVTDICLNGPLDAFFDRGNGMEEIQEVRTSAPWSNDSLRNWVLSLLAGAGKTWDARHPFADAVTQSGHRLHAVFPPISGEKLLVSLRRLPRLQKGDLRSPVELLNSRWGKSAGYWDWIIPAMTRGDSMLICGATGAGKTTLAQDLLAFVPPSERILALEDTPELAPNHPHWLSLESRSSNADGFGEVTIRQLLKQALRMRPDRIVLGECRGAEVLDLLQALNTGHRGALATLHANSPRDGLRRIELLCALHSGGTLSTTVIRELIASGIQWILQVQRHGAVRRITDVAKIEGREGDTILLRPMISQSYVS